MIAFTLAVTTGVLYAALSPPAGFSSLAWIALVPLICALDRAAAGRAAALAGTFGFVATVIITAWLAPTSDDYFERSRFETLFFVITVGATSIAPYFALSFGVLAYTQKRLPRTLWILMIPIAWVVAEYARGEFGLRSSWSLLGTSQAQAPYLRQIADITGVYGVGALIALGNAVFAETLLVARAWMRNAPATRFECGMPLIRAASVFAICLALTLAHGSARLSEPVGHEDYDVAIVQGNLDQSLRWKRGEALRVLRHYQRLSERAIGAKAGAPDLIIWPESALQKSVSDPLYGPPLAKMVSTMGVPLIVGAPRRDTRGHYNSVSMLTPGAEPQVYDKIRLLPFSEWHPIDALASLPARGNESIGEYVAGSEPGVFSWRDKRLGILICFEAIYPQMARAVVANGASVIFNLSNDGWFRGSGGPEQHLQQVVFRAIESGVPVVRATTTGISAVISPTGEKLAELGDGESGVLRVRVPAARPFPTAYVRYGDLFAHLCCAVLAIVALVCIWNEERSRRGEGFWQTDVNRPAQPVGPEAA